MKLEQEKRELLIYEDGVDNIFDISFMDDFTTIAVLIDEDEDVSHLIYKDEHDFYCYSEDKVYSCTPQELYKKFNYDLIIVNSDFINLAESMVLDKYKLYELQNKDKTEDVL